LKLGKISWFVAAVAAIVLSTQVVAGTAHAQVPAATQVDTMGKGTIGLGLVGAELGFVIPALVGVDETWAYVVFPTVGAAAGALTGFFLIDQPGTHQEIGVAALAAGMALVIPAMVLTLSETAYDPADDLDENSTIDGAEVPAAAAEDYEVGSGGSDSDAVDTGDSIDPGDSTGNTATPDSATPPPAQAAPEATPAPAPSPGASRRHRSRPLAAVGTGLLRVNQRGWFVGMPAVTTVATYSVEDMRRMGMSPRDQRAEVHVDLFSATF
jgi:hypothetical protein